MTEQNISKAATSKNSVYLQQVRIGGSKPVIVTSQGKFPMNKKQRPYSANRTTPRNQQIQVISPNNINIQDIISNGLNMQESQIIEPLTIDELNKRKKIQKQLQQVPTHQDNLQVTKNYLEAKHDVQKLFKDNHRLKSLMRDLKDDNIRFQEVLMAQENLIQSKFKVATVSTQKNEQFGKYIILKKEYQVLKEKLQETERNLLDYKQKIQYTSSQEFLMDLKNTVEDNFRLKASLDVLSKTIVIPNDKEQLNNLDLSIQIQQLQYKLNYQEHQLAQITAQKDKYENQMNFYKKQSQDYNQQIEQQSKQLKKVNNENETLKNILSLKNEEIKECQNNIQEQRQQHLSELNSNFEVQRIFQMNIQLNDQFDGLNKSLRQKEQEIQQLQLHVNDIQKYNQKLIAEINEIKQNQHKRRGEKSIQQLEEKISRSHDKKKLTIQSQQERQNEDQKFLESLTQKSKSGFRFKKISSFEVKDLGLQLKIKFLQKNISIDQFESILFQDQIDSVSQIDDLFALFKNDPFEIENHEIRLLLARYLVEDNEENSYIPNVELEQDNLVILSVFKRLIGSYQIFDQKTLKQFQQKTLQFTMKFQNKLLQWCNESLTIGQYMSHKRINDYFKLLDPELSSNVIEYVIMRSMTNDIQKIQIEKLRYLIEHNFKE